mgnify:CR=1 FL=1
MTQTPLKNSASEALQSIDAVLQVERSVLGKKWILTAQDERLASAISRSYDLPDIVARLLVARGITFDDVEAFLQSITHTS